MTSPNWKAQYAEIRPTYEVYEKKLRELVTTVLEHAKIDVVQVEGRVKTVDSFAEKISRKSGKYADPLKDMTDLVGLRIIAYYVEDVDRIVSLLRNEFKAIEEHSANKRSELAPDQFGYMSDHLIIRIGSRGAWPEWANYADIPVEFQVRTTLQHAWAAVNHKLSYKRVEEVPTSLQRRLFRLSALFEMADEQFSAIRKAASELSDEYSDNVKQGNLDIKIDADSIDAYIQNNTKVRGIMAAATKLGFVLSPVDGPGTERARSDLLRILDTLQARTIGEFDALLPDVAAASEAMAMNQQSRREIRPDLHPRKDAVEHEVLINLLVLFYDVPQSLFDTIYTTGWDFFLETRTRLRSRK